MLNMVSEREQMRYPRPALTISAFFEVIQGSFGKADVQSIRETVNLVAADLTPFKNHLRHVVMSMCYDHGR
jgi:hypothetical protein